MIQDVDAALEALVRREALNGSRVDVLFDAPTKDWVARRNAPTLDIYLYDIREDTSRRQTGLEPVRDASSGFVSARRMPVRRFRLSYLVTAWTQRPEDEHRILSSCLAAFVRNEFIPADLVGGALADTYPVYLHVGMPLPAERSIADVWSALGGELKPSLDLVAIAPLDPAYREPAAAPVLEGPTLGVGGPGLGRESVSRAGHGGAAGRGTPLSPADEHAQEEWITGGRIGVPRPQPTERATGTAAKPSRGRRGTSATDEAEDDGTREELALETIGGGRIVRVRGIPRP